MEEQSHAFTREQKAGYAVVIICGVLGVVFGLFYMVHHLHKPFIITYNGDRVLNGDEEQAKEIARQKREDTDGDGVNDYDELNVYASSPYLVDTDSDGYTDDFEITSGMDPACASGQPCEDTTNEIGEDPTFVDEETAAAAAEAADAAEEFTRMSEMLKGLTTEEIRALLIDSGAAEAEVTAMTDEEVQALYAEVIAQLETSGGLDALIQQAAAQTGS